MQGVYQITNVVSGKVYIGSAINVTSRWSDHLKNLRGGRHHSPKLQHAWNKYGEGNFILEVLEKVTDENMLIAREQYWLDTKQSYDDLYGYNICRTAGNRLGMSHTEETKALISKKKKGVKVDPVEAERLTTLRTGMKNSDEHNQKISLGNSGKVRTVEVKDRISKTLTGRVQPQATIEKRAEKLRGKVRTEEQRERYRQSKLGSKAPKAKLNESQVIEIYNRLALGETGTSLAKEYSVSPATISEIKSGRRWGHLTKGATVDEGQRD